jgi:hypothetical protein
LIGALLQNVTKIETLRCGQPELKISSSAENRRDRESTQEGKRGRGMLAERSSESSPDALAATGDVLVSY